VHDYSPPSELDEEPEPDELELDEPELDDPEPDELELDESEPDELEPELDPPELELDSSGSAQTMSSSFSVSMHRHPSPHASAQVGHSAICSSDEHCPFQGQASGSSVVLDVPDVGSS